MRPNRFLIALAAAAPLVLAACLLFGASGLGVPDLATTSGRAILTLRAERVAGGFAIGAALSCAGVLLQALLRNPLADPYVLGVSSGAGLGAAFAILSGLASTSVLSLPLIAFAGSAATLALVWAFAQVGGALSLYNLILSGSMVSSVCASVLMFLVASAPAEGLHSVMWWMLGNLEMPAGPLPLVLAAVLLGSLAAAWTLAPQLNAMTLGREMAHAVGVRPGATMVAGLTIATLLTATSVALAGLIGFVGLVVPHTMRKLVGPDHRRLIPAAFLGGGLFLAVCDALARTVMAPIEIPVGVVTSLIGGPFFLWLLRRRRQQGWVQ
jgi:iron complex transport system permease protein